MVSVASLLNLEPDREQLPTPAASIRDSSECSPTPSERLSKRPRLAKDAAIFQRSKVKGQVRFAPHEISDSRILEEMQKLNVYPLPLAKIADFSRHIPYNSDKKRLYEKTGRDAFEVFQYTFQPPGHERPYAVLWDYNIGLVRMTPFFKCCKFSKTVPSKMLNLNPGLRDICHSITGGALVAQGYWVPYDAARALAATFCWSFRYALVPIFGPDFPSICTRAESGSYTTMVIDNKIIRKCAQDMEAFRSLQRDVGAKHAEAHDLPSREAPAPRIWQDTTKHHSSFQAINRPTASMPIQALVESPLPCMRTSMRTPESSCLSSPAMSNLISLYTPATSQHTSRLPSPREILESRSREVMAPSPPPNTPESSDSDVSPKTMPRKRRFFGRAQAEVKRKRGVDVRTANQRCTNEADIRAAKILIDLRTAARKAREDDDSD